MIGALTPFVRSPSTPQSDLRGGDDARVGRGTSYQGQSKDPAAPQSGPQARGTGPEARSATATETPRPVAPPQGLLAIGMEGIEALQGIKPKAPGEKADQKVDHRGEKEAAPGELSEEEADQVRELKARDQEVRRHEQAHAAAGGAHAGAPSYQYQQGPDGQRYAVGGEVPIDVSPVAGDPSATVQKMRQVKAAANAPAQPSGQDRAVAATADAISQQAQAELLAQSTEKAIEKTADQTTEKTADKTGATEEIKGIQGGEKPEATSAPAAPTGAQPPALPDGKPEARSELAPQIQPDRKPASIGSTPEAPQFAAPGAAQASSQAPSQAPPQASSQANPPRDIRPGSFADISV